jgi:hypothetical protein
VIAFSAASAAAASSLCAASVAAAARCASNKSLVHTSVWRVACSACSKRCVMYGVIVSVHVVVVVVAAPRKSCSKSKCNSTTH